MEGDVARSGARYRHPVGRDRPIPPLAPTNYPITSAGVGKSSYPDCPLVGWRLRAHVLRRVDSGYYEDEGAFEDDGFAGAGESGRC